MSQKLNILAHTHSLLLPLSLSVVLALSLSLSLSLTPSTHRDRDQISRTMVLFSMTNLRHMLVHRSASFQGRGATHTHPQQGGNTHASSVRSAALSPVHNGSCARSSNSWPSYKCLDFASSRKPHQLHTTLRPHTNTPQTIKSTKRISRSRLRRHSIKK